MALTARERDGWRVNTLQIAAMSGEGYRLRASWKYPSRYVSSITGFNVLWYAYGGDGPASAWVVEDANVDKDQSTLGTWQHILVAPEDLDAKNLYVWVTPVPSGKWKADWVKSETVPSPRVADDYAAAMGQLGSVTGEMDHGAVTIGWERVNGYQRYVNVYRSMNGGGYALARQVSAALGSFVDSDIARGTAYRYLLRAVMSDGVTEGADTPVANGDSFDAPPLAVGPISAQALTPTSMKLTWANNGATGDEYRIEWSDDGDAWANNQTSAISSDTLEQAVATAYTIGGLDSGKRWYARVRRDNDAGESGWTDIVSSVLGTVPVAPTLGTLPGYVAADGSLTVAWAHNSEDASDQTAYEVEVNRTKVAEGSDSASTATLAPAALGIGDGGSMAVRVRTKGAHADWSPWSEEPTVAVWASPSVGVALTSGGSPVSGEATEMPLQIRVALPSYVAGNHAVAWWAEVAANEAYPSVGPDGRDVLVGAGDVLWSAEGIPDSGTTVPESGDACNRVCYLVTVGASGLRMEPNVTYVARGGCVTAAGMRATSEAAFSWAPSGEVPEPDATLAYDPSTLSMRVAVSCVDDEDEPAEGVSIAVWRVESGGSTVLVAEGLTHGTSCVDPHPDFGECAYRVVATDDATGVQSAADFMAEVGEGSVVIQWGERWDGIEAAEEVAPGVLSYAGRRVRLPYGIDLTEDREVDMAEVEYLGRRRPVLYVGSTVRQESSVSCDIVEDADPGVHARVRELLEHGGPCYVRTPSGTGFWASVRGSLSASMGGLSRLTLRIKRVEG